MKARPRILYAQPCLQPPGGGCGVSAWMLQHLAEVGEVTVMTLSPPDFAAIDAYCGTSLSACRFESRPLDAPWLDWLKKLGPGFALLESHLVMRRVKEVAHEYDLLVSSNNEQEFGRRAIEYVHYPWAAYPRPDAPPGWNEHPVLSRLIRLYRFLCCWVSGYSLERAGENLTLVNSAWTGRVVKACYPHRSPVVLYPPTLNAAPEPLPPDKRLPRFLNLGRISPEKRQLMAIEIVERLRALGHDVGLTLVGSVCDSSYQTRVEEAAAGRPWVELVLDATSQEIGAYLGDHAYGLHAMADEHYGMAVAELVASGCLTMVCDDGGQTEIVTDPRLWYGTVEEAVQKWHAILSQPELEAELRAGQSAQADGLSAARFKAEFAELVHGELHRLGWV